MVIPGQLTIYFMMNRTIAVRLLGEFETWYLSGLLLLAAICYVDLVSGEPFRAFAIVVCFLFGMGILIFNDAQLQGSGSGRFMTIGYIFGLAFLLGIMLTLQLGASKGIYSRKIKLSPAGIDIATLDVLIFANNRLMTFCFFVMKNIFLKLRYPGSYAVLRARLMNTKTTKSKLQPLLDSNSRATLVGSFTARREKARGKVRPESIGSHRSNRRLKE
eukprot:g3270.t1